MFGRIARQYDRMNGLMTWGRDRAWRRLAARLANPASGRPALDLCCGTGEQTLELARLGRGPALGIDFTRPMLRLAAEKARRAGLSHVVLFQEADALRLPFRDGTFSCAVTTFSLRNVADVSALLAEMRRVVVPGGRVVTTELFGPPRGPLAPLGRLYQRLIVPALGAVIAGDGDAYAYLPASTTFVPSAEGTARLLMGVGLSRVSYRSLALGSVAIHVGERAA
jgi:demethylmenaquinone methyltransferase/2-methoxy-6-polyprenyl-1,4-benzoquinol methylase